MTYVSFNSYNIRRTLFLDFQNVEVNSETVKMLDISDSINEKTVDNISSDITFSDQIDYSKKNFQNNFFMIVISKNELGKKYSRKYPFIDELIGDAALLTSWVSVFLGFFYSFYSEQKYKSYMFERMVYLDQKKIEIRKKDFKEIEDVLKENENNKESNIIKNDSHSHNIQYNFEQQKFKEENNKKSNIIELSNLENSQIPNSFRNLEEQKIFSEIRSNSNKSKENKLYEITENDLKTTFKRVSDKKIESKLTFYDYICHIFNIKNNKMFYLIQKISEKFEKKLDIIYYFKNLKNLKIFKKIFLDKNQICLNLFQIK